MQLDFNQGKTIYVIDTSDLISVFEGGMAIEKVIELFKSNVLKNGW